MIQKNERRDIMDAPSVQVRSGKITRIEGYALRFDSDTQIGPRAFERISSGAIDPSGDVIATINHDDNQILGRTSAGTLELRMDSYGLHYSVDIDSDSIRMNDLAVDIRRGSFGGSSYEFVALKEHTERVGRRSVRHLDEIGLRQVGPVLFPANAETTIQARAKQEQRERQFFLFKAKEHYREND